MCDMNKHEMELITHFLKTCVHFQADHWSGLPYLAWWYSICMELSALP